MYNKYQYMMPVYYYEDEVLEGTFIVNNILVGHTGKTIKLSISIPDDGFVNEDNDLQTLYGYYSGLPKVNYRSEIEKSIEDLTGLSLYKDNLLIYGNEIDESQLSKIHFMKVVSTKKYPYQLHLALLFFESDLKLGSFAKIGYIENKQEKERKKEKKTMTNNIFGSLRTGKAGNNYAITYLGGVSFKNKTYYNGKIYEVDGMTFPFDMLYFIPSTEVKKNDIIEKDGVAYHITEVNKSGAVTAINLVDGKEETLIPGGPFGMSMYSKLFNPFGQMKGDNAFGNMMLMQAMSGNDSGNGNAMMMAMLMSQGGFQLPTFQMPEILKTTENTKSN